MNHQPFSSYHPETRSQLIRAALLSTDDTQAQQLMQLAGVSGQVIGEAVRSQHFGLSSNPPLGSEGLVLVLGGGLSRAHALGMEHPQYRPTNLGVGATTVYDVNGNRTDYSSTGIKHTDKTGNVVEMKSDRITVKPASSLVTIYVGGDGSTGSYAPLVTTAGPCLPNVRGRWA